MRGNPIVEIIAILVMLASVLVGGGYWLINKQEHKVQKKEENVLQTLNKEATVELSVKAKPLTFEQAVKETKE